MIGKGAGAVDRNRLFLAPCRDPGRFPVRGRRVVRNEGVHGRGPVPRLAVDPAFVSIAGLRIGVVGRLLPDGGHRDGDHRRVEGNHQSNVIGFAHVTSCIKVTLFALHVTSCNKVTLLALHI